MLGNRTKWDRTPRLNAPPDNGGALKGTLKEVTPAALAIAGALLQGGAGLFAFLPDHPEDFHCFDGIDELLLDFHAASAAALLRTTKNSVPTPGIAALVWGL